MGFITGQEDKEPERQPRAFVHEGEGAGKDLFDKKAVSTLGDQKGSGFLGFQNLGQFDQYVADMANVAGTSITGGIPDMIGAGLEGTLNLIRGKDEPYGRAWDKHISPNKESRDRLSTNNPVAAFLTEMGAGFVPIGVGAKADALVDAGTAAKQLAPNTGKFGWLGNMAAKAGKLSTAGAVTNVLNGVAYDETSKEQVLTNGTVGALMAPVVDVIVGTGTRTGQKVLDRLFVRDDFGKALTNMVATGPNTEGLRFSTMAKWLDERSGNSTGSFQDIPFDKVGGPEESTRRMYNSLAEIYLPKLDDAKRGLNRVERDVELYHKALDTQYKLSVDADNKARLVVSDVLGSPRQRVTAIENSDADIKKAREVYRMMSDETPQANPDGSPRLDANGEQVMGLGAKPIDVRADIVPALDERLLSKFNKTAITRLSDEANKMREAFLSLLRTREVDAAALRNTKIQSQGSEKFHAGEVDVYNDVTLSRLLDARKTFATKMLSPMSTVGGDAITRSERAAAREMLGMIDDIIEENTGGAFKKAKGQFARSMKLQEAYDMGKEFYTSRTSDFADNKRFVEEYGKDLTTYLGELNDDNLKDMFRAGFSEGMQDKIGQRGFMTEMHYFLGDFKNDPETGLFFKANEKGIEQIKSIFGEEEAQKLLDTYSDTSVMQQYRAKLATMLRAKGSEPTSIHSFIDTATEAQSRKRADPRASVYEAGVGMIDWAMRGKGDKREARALMRLLSANDDEVAYLIERGMKEAGKIKPTTSNRAIMGGLLSGFAPDEDGDSEADRALRDYLDSVQPDQ